MADGHGSWGSNERESGSGWSRHTKPPSGKNRPPGHPQRKPERSVLYVHTDHNSDDVRTFYEIPDALVEMVRRGCPEEWTFTRCLAEINHD